MYISDSSIQLSSERTALEHQQKRESLIVWKNGQQNKIDPESIGKGQDIEIAAQAAVQDSVKLSLSSEALKTRRRQQVVETVPDEKTVMMSLNMRILQAMIERLTGKVIHLASPDEVVPQNNPEEVGSSGAGQGADLQGDGSGLSYEYHETHYEYESTSFEASGKVLTSDGKEIDFSLQMSMSREFLDEKHISIKTGEALKDPLVVNFSGTAAELTQQKFAFDIDSDGLEDQISFVGSGSGFLALDSNNNGKIDEGSELFGTKSGDGFKDLARYDSDNNNWIDENDDIYSRLRIWSRDSDGNEQLFALGQKGIGALYLGHMSTEFSIKDQDNSLLGQVRSTGVFLREDGSSGTLQQVDLVV